MKDIANKTIRKFFNHPLPAYNGGSSLSAWYIIVIIVIITICSSIPNNDLYEQLRKIQEVDNSLSLITL